MDSSITATAATAATNITKTQDEHTRNWANLPSDIFQNLVNYLDLKIDIPRVRGVCVNWRSALPHSIIPEIPTCFEIPGILNNRPLYLVETRFYFLSPLNPALGGQWIGRLTQLGSGPGLGPKKWHICNPLNADNYFFSSPSITGEINLLNCRAQQLCTSWIVSETGSGMTSHNVGKKVVGGWNFKSSYLFAVLAQLETPGHGGEGGLVMWRVGDEECTRFEQSFAHPWCILDIAYVNGRFYAFDIASWRMGVINLDDYGVDDIPQMNFFNAPDIKGDYIKDWFALFIDGCNFLLSAVYLVPSNGRLFMIVLASPVAEFDDKEESEDESDEEEGEDESDEEEGEDEEESELDEFDEEEGEDEFHENEDAEKKNVMFYFVLKEGKQMEDNTWERVPDIGDNIFFIGYDTSFSLPSASTNLPLWKPGSVCLFIWPFHMDFDNGEPNGIEDFTFAEYWRYLKLYQHNAEEEEEKGLVRFEELGKHKYTGLFFPPPAWVIWRCPSRGNAVVVLHNLKFNR